MKESILRIFQNRRRTLLIVFLGALFVRVVFVVTLQDRFYFPDSIEYSNAAVNLLTHGTFGEEYNRPPGYPVFLAAIYFLFGENIVAVRVVESVLGALLAVMVVLIGHKACGHIAGTIAGILWSIYPLGVFIAGLVYPTSLFAFLLASSTLILFSSLAQKIRPGRVTLAGFVLGVSALIIPIALATVAAVSGWAIFYLRKQRMAFVALFVIGSGLALLPWGVREFSLRGRIVPIEPRVIEHLPKMRSADEELRNSRIQAILRYPGEYASRFGREFVHFWKLYPDRITMDEPGLREHYHEQDRRMVKETIFGANNLIIVVSLLSTGPLFFFGIVGSAAMLVDGRHRRDLALLWSVILSVAVGYSFFFTQTRYRIPIEPYIAVLSGYGLQKLWNFLSSRYGFAFASRNGESEGKPAPNAGGIIG